MKRLFLLILILISISTPIVYSQNNNIDLLSDWFQGKYNTSDQAKIDSLIIDKHLSVTPFSISEQTGKWFYLETSFSSSPNSPYRQEVYHFHPAKFGFLNLDIYTIVNKSKFKKLVEKDKVFEKNIIDQFTKKNKCSIYLKFIDDLFIGSTSGKLCKSTIRNASYATTEIEITEGDFFLWERGFDLRENQVWGSKENGYIFIKIKHQK